METIIIIVISLIALCVYFYPTTLAITQKKNNIAIIMVLNAIGFLVITWFIALIIAKKSKVREGFVINENNSIVKAFKKYNDWDYWNKKGKYKDR